MPTHDDGVVLSKLEAEARRGGGEHLQRRQRRLGRLLARERIATLVDPDSFVELGAFVRSAAVSTVNRPQTLGDGVVCGLGRIDGRPVAVYAYDPTVLRGALGVGGAEKIVRLLDLAREQAVPVVALHDSDGVRVDEGPRALAGFGDVIGRTAQLSGWVPQIGVVLGICVGGAAYSSALQDIIIGHSENGFVFVTGAKVTQVVTGVDDPIDEIGGVAMHARTTGLVHLASPSEDACIGLARELLSYLPLNATESPPAGAATDPWDRDTSAIAALLPSRRQQPYDMHGVLAAVFDKDSLLELQPAYGRSLLVGLGRLHGRPVGFVASQPAFNAGCLDCDASRKGARFVQFCNAFGLPVITLADVPGFLPGKREEQGGLLLHGAKLISAYALCRVPLVSLIVRNSYGGGNVLSYPADVRLAYPQARVQPMGTEAALAVAAHSVFGERSPAEEGRLAARLGAAYDAMPAAAESGFVDRVIRPERTRREIITVLGALLERPTRSRPSRRVQTNMPL